MNKTTTKVQSSSCALVSKKTMKIEARLWATLLLQPLPPGTDTPYPRETLKLDLRKLLELQMHLGIES